MCEMIYSQHYAKNSHWKKYNVSLRLHHRFVRLCYRYGDTLLLLDRQSWVIWDRKSLLSAAYIIFRYNPIRSGVGCPIRDAAMPDVHKRKHRQGYSVVRKGSPMNSKGHVSYLTGVGHAKTPSAGIWNSFYVICSAQRWEFVVLQR
jgi:hypothetical protein